MLTALDSPEERVEGLKIGADDYLPKPFDFDELIARIEALHRRATGYATNASDTLISSGALTFDKNSLQVRVDGAFHDDYGLKDHALAAVALAKLSLR